MLIWNLTKVAVSYGLSEILTLLKLVLGYSYGKERKLSKRSEVKDKIK